MAVLVEALSVVVRLDAIRDRFEGGLPAFVAQIHSSAFCMDGELARVAFLSLTDADAFVHRLEARGLAYIFDGVARDLVVVDQIRGASAPCDWLEVGQVQVEGGIVTAARMAGSSGESVVTPEGWRYENSHSQRGQRAQ